MGEFSEQLDNYLDAFEAKIGTKLEIPEKLMTRRLINKSIDLQEKSKHIENSSPHNLDATYPVISPIKRNHFL